MRVVGYCRFSSENQREGYSIEAQKRAIEDYCAREGHTVIDYFIDEARSGTNDDREQFQSMIGDAASKRFQAVIVHKLDRFARDRYDSAVYKKKLKDSGVRLISVLEPLDDSPESVMMESVLEGMAEYYSRNLSREVLKGKKVAAQNAQHPGGMPPYGFEVDLDMRYKVVPSEAEVIKRIFDLLDKGYSLAGAARILKDSGIKNRLGRYMNNAIIARMIANPIYKGQYVFGRRSKTGTQVIVDDAVDAIVSPEQWQRVNNMAKARADKFKPKYPTSRNKGDDYVLTGHVFCGYCGSHLFGFTSRKVYQNTNGANREYIAKFYRCAKKSPRDYVMTGRTKGCNFKNIKKDDFESFVFRSIEQIIFSDETMRLIVDKIQERLSERMKSKSDVDSLEKEIVKLKNQQQRLLDLYLDGSLDIPTYNSRKSELATSIEFYSDKLSKSFTIKPESVTFDLVKSRIAKFLESPQADSLDYKKLLLCTFVDSIVIDNENIVIYFKFPLPPLRSDDPTFVCNRATASTCAPLRTELLIKVLYPVEAVWFPELVNDLHISIQL